MANFIKRDDGRSRRRTPGEPLPAITVVQAFKDDPLGLIPTKYLFDPIEIQLEEIWFAPAQLGEEDIVKIMIDPDGPETPYALEPIVLKGPVLPEHFPVRTTIKGNWLRVSGTYHLTYEIEGPGGVEPSPYTTTFTVDWIAPGGTRLMAAAELPAGLEKITEDYLEANDTVDLIIPAYDDRKAFDEVLIFLLDSSDANPHQEVFTYSLDSATGPIIVPVPGDLFRELKNGSRGIRYTLRDRAGNQRFDYAHYTDVLIDLDAPPSGLQLPYVAAYAFDNLIDRADARETVLVRIDPYFDHKVTDEVVVYWNQIELAKVPVDVLPKTVRIPWATLIAKGYLQNNFPVQYSIHRSGSSKGLFSPILRVTADYSVAGPDHTAAPQLYNATLAKVEVRGPGSNTPNYLDIRDFEQSVTVTLVLDDDYQVGHWLDLYWGALEDPVGTYRIKPEDSVGTTITFPPVPWAVVQLTLVDPKFPVYYATHNGVNDQLAPEQLVNINIVKPVQFERADAPDANNGAFNCDSLPPLWEAGVRIRINAHSAIKVGDEIRLKWVGTTGFAGGGEVIVVEVFIEDWSLDDQNAGFHIFAIPYETYIKPLKDDDGGSAEFGIWRKGGIVGSSRSPRYLRFDRRRPSHGDLIVYCGPDGDGPE